MNSPRVVILGAAEPFAGSEPSALVQTSGDRRTLDWIIDAFETALPDPELHFIGGYRIDEVIDAYPGIHFSHNERWEETGTVASLFSAPVQADAPLYVCYADTVFEASVIEALDGEPVSIAVDSTWQNRYRERDDASLERAEKVAMEEEDLVDIDEDLGIDAADAEFTGLARFSPEAIERAQSFWNSRVIDESAMLPDLLRALAASGLQVTPVDIEGDWAELETAEDLSRFVLDTKANTLRRLKSRVDTGVILDQYTFDVGTWASEAGRLCAEMQDVFDEEPVIVRSSAQAEDGWEESNAGAFESILDVPTDDAEALEAAIETVIDSYPDDREDNQVLVQPMIDDVAQSGVVMTRALDAGSPYYVINYDATTASTETVTDGSGNHLQTAIVRRDMLNEGTLALSAEEEHVQWPSDIALEPLLRTVREIEDLLGHDTLDIEFAIDHDGTVYVLQTRPMTLDPGTRSVTDEAVFDILDAAEAAFADAQATPPHLHGSRTIYGVMPDWNPAEIIGRQPRQLAASLYRYLVMDDVWATQRAEYGYKDVRPAPLMKSFAGQPYVDVRADFNSFIPASVPDDLAERLVEYYLDRLAENPELHDKIEFEIVLTCLPFDFEQRIEPLLEHGFTREELEPLREGLREITEQAMDRVDGDLDRIDQLEQRYEEIMEADLPPLETAHLLLEDCRRLGTLPFAHLARSAFVATSMLRSLERIEVLSSEDVATFQNSLNTVARQFEDDGRRVAGGNLAWETFVERYGHLRPGTYEMTSPRYDADPDRYLEPLVTSQAEELMTDGAGISRAKTAWDEATKDAIRSELDRIGLETDVDDFIDFLVTAIEGREYGKFVFSRNLSQALEELAAFGEQYDLDREACSYIPLEVYLACVSDQPTSDIGKWLRDQSKEGKRRHELAKAVELPPLLMESSDFVVFERPEREANFVTDEVVTADIVEVVDTDDAPDLEGAIVLIPQADPGYDWLFGHDIAGLITMYGGANSHMAVRAAEFSLPAAIGVGESHYEQLRGAGVVELDCAGLTTRIIQ